MASSAARGLEQIRLPSGGGVRPRRRRAVVSTASSPLPTLAPSTRPSATFIGSMPAAASVAVSSTMARLEYDSTVSTAPTTMSSSTSLGSATSSAHRRRRRQRRVAPR